MSFIPKSPLMLPEIEHTPSTPSGTRGLFAKEDGWYDIDSNGKVSKIANDEAVKNLGAIKSSVHILGGVQNWTIENITDANGSIIGSRYGQTVNVNNAVITQNSKVDLHASSEQIIEFFNEGLAFVAENDNGVVTVYCIGDVPKIDYEIQAVVTEVVIDE